MNPNDETNEGIKKSIKRKIIECRKRKTGIPLIFILFILEIKRKHSHEMKTHVQLQES